MREKKKKKKFKRELQAALIPCTLNTMTTPYPIHGLITIKLTHKNYLLW